MWRGREDEEEQEENNKNEAEEKVDMSPEFKIQKNLKLIQKNKQNVRYSSKLFSNLAFFVSREVSRESTQFMYHIIRWYHGLGWRRKPFSKNDRRITHHIVDRPIAKKYLTVNIYNHNGYTIQSMHKCNYQ